MFSVVVVYIIDYISQSLSHFLVVGRLSFLLLIEQDQMGSGFVYNAFLTRANFPSRFYFVTTNILLKKVTFFCKYV